MSRAVHNVGFTDLSFAVCFLHVVHVEVHPHYSSCIPAKDHTTTKNQTASVLEPYLCQKIPASRSKADFENHNTEIKGEGNATWNRQPMASLFQKITSCELD